MPAYAASKWALESAMESLASSVAPFSIRVAVIEPGVILTPIFSKGGGGAVPAPYQPALDALMGILMHDLARASDPSVVAECIADAATTENPKFRHLVGQGAERNVTWRASMTDEEYIGLGLLPADEQVARWLGTDS